MEEYEALVKRVLARLERHDLTVFLNQTVFDVDTVEFLRYIVGNSGVTMRQKKVESVRHRAPRRIRGSSYPTFTHEPLKKS